MRWFIGAFVLVAAVMLGSGACASDPGGSTEGMTTTNGGGEGGTVGVTETETLGDGDGDTGDGDGDTGDGDPDDGDGDGDGDGDDTDPGMSECDPFAQDCPEDEKCVAYASTGGSWDANKCVPIMGDNPPGTDCNYGGTSEGTDDCDESSYCFFVDNTDHGVCTPFCLGDWDDPQCADGTICLIVNSNSLTLCVPTCHPVTQGCESGTCLFFQSTFLCLIEFLEPEPLGQPCAWINQCEAGNVCVAGDTVPECETPGCCAQYCDLDDMNFECTIAGASCVPFFAEDPPPMGYENVGVCLLPPP